MSMNERRPMTESGFQELRAAVVKQACEDYLKASDGFAKSMVRGWFRSDAFHFWCDADPDAILRRLNTLRRRKIPAAVLTSE